VTGGEKTLRNKQFFVISGAFYLSLSQKSKIFDSSLVRGSQGALRALSPHRGDLLNHLNNNLPQQKGLPVGSPFYT
jgi:hypothetical protein